MIEYKILKLKGHKMSKKEIRLENLKLLRSQKEITIISVVDIKSRSIHSMWSGLLQEITLKVDDTLITVYDNPFFKTYATLGKRTRGYLWSDFVDKSISCESIEFTVNSSIIWMKKIR